MPTIHRNIIIGLPLSIMLLIVAYGCSTISRDIKSDNAAQLLNKLSWIEGTWINIRGDTITKETWVRKSEGEMKSEILVYKIINASSSAYETIHKGDQSIIIENENILINKGDPASPLYFPLVEITDSTAKFEMKWYADTEMKDLTSSEIVIFKKLSDITYSVYEAGKGQLAYESEAVFTRAK